MVKGVFQFIVVFFLSFLLLFGSTAKEYVHLFVHHEDTIHIDDHICPEGEAHLDTEHHHCTFLHFVLEPFANDYFIPRIFFVKPLIFKPKAYLLSQKYIEAQLRYICLRGPPL